MNECMYIYIYTHIWYIYVYDIIWYDTIRYDMIWYDMMCMYYSIYTYTYYIVIYQNRSYYLPQRGILPATPLCVERRVWGSPSIRRGRTNMLRSVSSSTKRYPEQEWGWTRLGKFEATRITKKKEFTDAKTHVPYRYCLPVTMHTQSTQNPRAQSTQKL